MFNGFRLQSLKHLSTIMTNLYQSNYTDYVEHVETSSLPEHNTTYQKKTVKYTN